MPAHENRTLSLRRNCSCKETTGKYDHYFTVHTHLSYLSFSKFNWYLQALSEYQVEEWKKQQGYARFNNSCIAWTYSTPAAVAQDDMSNLVQYELVKFYSMPTEKSAHCRKSMYLTYPKILYASTYWGKNKFWGEHQEKISQQLAITCLHIFYSSLLSPPLISCL
jgi:hypothetical protein